jgi:transcription elongation factor GreA
VELRIAELEEMLKPGGYNLIDSEAQSKKKKSGINVGNTVTLEEFGEKTRVTYVIVGAQEANIFENKISNESPLGKSLIGKNTGDTAKMIAPSGTKEYTVTDVK